jgi:hypothetical protein
MSANQVAVLAQSLSGGQSYSQVAIAGLLAGYPAGTSLQIGPDGGPSVAITLAQAAGASDEVLYAQAFIPPNTIPSGAGIFDPTSSTGAGATTARPVNVTVGAQFYDTTLGKPIWYSGSVWKDAVGTTV